MLRALALLPILLLSACATPVSHSTTSLETYDKDTKYGIKELESGFSITVRYSRYQFIPESGAVATACKSQLTSIAWEYADNINRKIKPLNEQRIKLSMGRNGFTGITSCQAYGKVEWE